MKIEKINENQIRCTLNKEDLESHQIRISELAYGTDKAKKLFRDMMEQAALQFGFKADNIPLMIEAIPLSTESVILIVTKVEDPEELDTRFSKFAPFKSPAAADTLHFDGADNIIDIFRKLYEAKAEREPLPTSGNPERDALLNALANEAALEADEDKESDGMDLDIDDQTLLDDPDLEVIRLYEFETLDDVAAASRGLCGYFKGDNLLFKADGRYKLVIHQTNYLPGEFNKICNILSEYAPGRPFTHAAEAFLLEHGNMITRNAVQKLSQL